MVSWRTEWKRSAEKELRKLPREILPRIISAVGELATDPTPPCARKLVGSENSFRIRVGDYRELYTIDGLVIKVVRVGHRREYR